MEYRKLNTTGRYGKGHNFYLGQKTDKMGEWFKKRYCLDIKPGRIYRGSKFSYMNFYKFDLS